MDGDAAAVVAFLGASTWPWHSTPSPTAEELEAEVAAGGWSSGPTTETRWIVAAGERVGLVRLWDLEDPTPMFDLRIATGSRGHGLGTSSVRWLTAWAFDSRPDVRRIEATTRVDNLAMRRVLRRCGYAKEAHYRQGWDVAGSEPVDAVGYAITRSDWEAGRVTPPDWNDE